jgi:trans-2,3-dihydro-3-hydroxyanthranilate isomerase
MPLLPFQGLQYRQVDVFADSVLNGNGVAVFWDCDELSIETMQGITRELGQFESIFLAATGTSNEYRAKVFTMEEELDFAGHPVLGASAVLHERYGKNDVETWRIALNVSTIEVTTRRKGKSYVAAMSQPKAQFSARIKLPSETETMMHALNLNLSDKHPTLPLEVGSTGLAYLIVPIVRNLEKARIVIDNMQETLDKRGARFVYVYDVEKAEGRNWDNKGLVEDVATGSAAGLVAAYLYRHGLLTIGQELRIKQGRYAGRPSEMGVKVLSSGHVEVTGVVQMVASGTFD